MEDRTAAERISMLDKINLEKKISKKEFKAVREEMEHAADLAVPLTVEVKSGHSWAEAH